MRSTVCHARSHRISIDSPRDPILRAAWAQWTHSMSVGSRLREGPHGTAALHLWCRRTAYARPKHCEAGTRAERLFRASSVVALSLLALLQAFHAAERMRPRISG
jgi:hypothetical protein